MFAGAQELYRLCEDDTSPIGSRAAKHCLTSLMSPAIREMASIALSRHDSSDRDRIADEVYGWTGGHAGLSSGLLRLLSDGTQTPGATVTTAAAQFRTERSELFHLWSNSLTREARPVHDSLLRHERLDRSEIGDLLRKSDLPVHRLDRIVDELQYVGIAKLEGGWLVANNKLYRDQATLYSGEETCSDSERSVWNLIEETEIGLRKLVRQQFSLKWGNSADQMIERALGGESWEKIIENRDKYAKSYALSGPLLDAAEILNFTYLGQLGILMTWKKSWHLFQGLFRDMRELQDMLRDIMPVRNDGAHFRAVPEHELDRCRVRCVDLLAILESNAQAGPSVNPETPGSRRYSHLSNVARRAAMGLAPVSISVCWRGTRAGDSLRRSSIRCEMSLCSSGESDATIRSASCSSARPRRDHIDISRSKSSKSASATSDLKKHRIRRYRPIP